MPTRRVSAWNGQTATRRYASPAPANRRATTGRIGSAQDRVGGEVGRGGGDDAPPEATEQSLVLVEVVVAVALDSSSR